MKRPTGPRIVTVTRQVNVTEIGRLGGYARAARMSPEERSEAARKAVRERWRKYREAQAAEERDRLRGMEETEAVDGQG